MKIIWCGKFSVHLSASDFSVIATIWLCFEGDEVTPEDREKQVDSLLEK